MTALIVKNDDFKTIGLEVKNEKHCLFSWGISPLNKSNFIKEILADKWTEEIVQLIRIEREIQVQENFIHDFFEVARKNKLLKKDQSVNFKEYEEGIEFNKRKLIQIINKIN